MTPHLSQLKIFKSLLVVDSVVHKRRIKLTFVIKAFAVNKDLDYYFLFHFHSDQEVYLLKDTGADTVFLPRGGPTLIFSRGILS